MPVEHDSFGRLAMAAHGRYLLELSGMWMVTVSVGGTWKAPRRSVGVSVLGGTWLTGTWRAGLRLELLLVVILHGSRLASYDITFEATLTAF